MATLLCVDDHPHALTIRKMLLETKGYTVLTAEDGPSGIRLVGKHTVDAVVLDYKMPGMDGAQVAAVLRREHPTIPIVLLTGIAVEVPERLLCTVDAYVRKGESAEVLLSSIEKVLSHRNRKPSSGTRPSRDERDQEVS
jgi:CheY-like chemotaxis protein